MARAEVPRLGRPETSTGGKNDGVEAFGDRGTSIEPSSMTMHSAGWYWELASARRQTSNV
jgi:hypothetical protein